MKKTYKFEENNEAYVIVYNENVVYTINKDNLKINGDQLYENFFSEYLIGDEIMLEKGNPQGSNDKLFDSVYDSMRNLFTDICRKINELEE